MRQSRNPKVIAAGPEHRPKSECLLLHDPRRARCLRRGRNRNCWSRFGARPNTWPAMGMPRSCSARRRLATEMRLGRATSCRLR